MKLKRLCFANLFFALILAGQQTKPPKDATVWVIDDTVKIHPITGNLLREGIDTYSGKKPSQGDYRRKNTVWDAETQTVKLFAGRNEFVSFQIVLEKGKEELHKVFVNATDLLGSKARISADSHIRMFKQLYFQNGGVWYGDALEPFEIAGAAPLELPDLHSPLGDRQTVQSVWVDIYVPHALPPDKYTGQIMIVHRATNKQAILRVELDVGAFTLSDKLHLDIDLMNYGFVNIERGWPDMVIDSPRHRKIEREFFRIAHEHRMSFAIVPYNHDGSIPKGLKPELAGVGENIHVADWRSWDERFGPVLSGEAFADLPRSGQPVGHFFLPYNLMWPSDMRNWQKPEYAIEYKRIGQEFRSHLAEKGWTKPVYHIYYNHKEHYEFFPWNLDEPTRDKDFEALKYLGGLIKESFPNDGPVKVLYRLDIGHFFCKNVPTCKNPRAESQKAIDVLGSVVDLWNIGSAHFFPNAAEGQKLKAMGKTVFFYGPISTPLSSPLLNAVHWGWDGYRYQVDGICLWNTTDWTNWDVDEPPPDPYTSAGGRYQGVSILFYPGSKFGYDGPIPSVRLKAMRRGFQDFEYLRLIEEKGLKTRAELAKVADTLLQGKEKDYTALRRSLYDLLATR